MHGAAHQLAAVKHKRYNCPLINKMYQTECASIANKNVANLVNEEYILQTFASGVTMSRLFSKRLTCQQFMCRIQFMDASTWKMRGWFYPSLNFDVLAPMVNKFNDKHWPVEIERAAHTNFEKKIRKLSSTAMFQLFQSDELNPGWFSFILVQLQSVGQSFAFPKWRLSHIKRIEPIQKQFLIIVASKNSSKKWNEALCHQMMWAYARGVVSLHKYRCSRILDKFKTKKSNKFPYTIPKKSTKRGHFPNFSIWLLFEFAVIFRRKFDLKISKPQSSRYDWPGKEVNMPHTD